MIPSRSLSVHTDLCCLKSCREDCSAFLNVLLFKLLVHCALYHNIQCCRKMQNLYHFDLPHDVYCFLLGWHCRRRPRKWKLISRSLKACIGNSGGYFGQTTGKKFTTFLWLLCNVSHPGKICKAVSGIQRKLQDLLDLFKFKVTVLICALCSMKACTEVYLWQRCSSSDSDHCAAWLQADEGKDRSESSASMEVDAVH